MTTPTSNHVGDDGLITVHSARSPEEFAKYKLHRRFDRMARLIGEDKMQKLAKSHVMIVGLGGVGSWIAESLARSGVGKLTLVDNDTVCVTNVNRQLQALTGEIGKPKAQVLAERMKKINPSIVVEPMAEFYNAQTAVQIFSTRPDFVADAIDNMTAKCHLIHKCVSENIPLVSSQGSAGRMDPLAVKVADLSKTEHDPMAKFVRKILREKHNFPRSGKFGVTAVYSDETPTDPFDLSYDNGKGFTCVCPDKNEFNACDNKNLIRGTSSFVTGTFGLVMSSYVVKELLHT